MYPPSQSMNLSIEAISGITGSVSIACWVVVFSPQIIENFRRGSGDGLSLTFLALWLAGDVFNVLGAWLQGVLPTMVILAVYYTFADIILLGQCLYYRRINNARDVLSNGNGVTTSTVDNEEATEDAPLLSRSESYNRRISIRSLSDNAHHLSPATPFIEPEYLPGSRKASFANGHPELDSIRAEARRNTPVSVWRSIVFNTVAVVMVVGAGVGGWYISNDHPRHDKSNPHRDEERLEYNTLGQVFGYLCAVLYLGSRLPQIVLNFRRKSCEGVSLLFFLFACLGNTTYVVSIFAYEPGKSPGQGYGRYLGVNASWLAGSLGTLFLDFIIFAQFFLYSQDNDDDFSEDDGDEDAEVIVSP